MINSSEKQILLLAIPLTKDRHKVNIKNEIKRGNERNKN
jgi:hypothetical protein